MDVASFERSLLSPTPPPGLSQQLLALWHAGRGGWDDAHKIVQDEHDTTSALIHAYLHRLEGDEGNAAYWYRRAGRAMPVDGLRQEWRLIVGDVLAGGIP